MKLPARPHREVPTLAACQGAPRSGSQAYASARIARRAGDYNTIAYPYSSAHAPPWEGADAGGTPSPQGDHIAHHIAHHKADTLGRASYNPGFAQK